MIDPQNGCFISSIIENPIKMDDLGVSLFQETSISIQQNVASICGKKFTCATEINYTNGPFSIAMLKYQRVLCLLRP